IMQRSLGYPLLNFGFSGNGKLEKEVLQFISEPNARLFILDCLANIANKSESEVTNLVIEAVKQLRKTSSAPILLIESAGYSNSWTDKTKHDELIKVNSGSLKAYNAIQTEGIKEVYYISREDINFPVDGWVDYVHPSDYGMQHQAMIVENKVREILNIPVGTISTTIPVTQRREPDSYEWQARHRAIIDLEKSNPPKALIIGNSITNYWGGEPNAHIKNGPVSWNNVMRPAGFINLGYGWDRIENVLWRVYHDELDGFNTEKIVLMIGTNNFETNSDQEIVDGLRFLLAAIKYRQPKATIKIMGILPRRAMEERVRNINVMIRQMAEKDGYKFADVSSLLVNNSGMINESLFNDGLHPNERGYSLIASKIAE
ncbi:MAG: SGNH/GDSL hydrolase family protein, partial [Bacteroidales bacterium]